MKDYSELTNKELRRKIAETQGYEFAVNCVVHPEGTLISFDVDESEAWNKAMLFIPEWVEEDCEALTLLDEIASDDDVMSIDIAWNKSDGWMCCIWNKVKPHNGKNSLRARAISEACLAWLETNK